MTRFYMGRVPLHTVRFALVLVSILLACLSFVWLSHPVSAAPSTMNFQGRLMNSAGNVMPDGLYNMQFKLYDASTSGTLLWSETRENNGSDYRVQVTNGLFSTKLGQRTALTASVFSGNSVYFEITLPTPATATCSTASCASWESPMAPRHQLSTSAYAFNSDTLDGLDSTAFGQLSGANTWANTNTVSVSNANAFKVQDATSLAVLTADTSANLRIQIGSSTTDATAIFFMLDSYNNGTDPTGANGAMYYNTNTNKFRCYQASAWSDCIGSGGGGANTGLSNLASVAINQSLVAGTGNSIDIGSSGTTWRAGYFGTSLNTPTLRPAADGTTAFKLQNAAGTADYLTLDTTNNRLTLGTSDTTGFLLVLDTKTDATDPTGVNGGMYYNSNLGKFRCYENGVWKDCVAPGVKSTLGYRYSNELLGSFTTTGDVYSSPTGTGATTATSNATIATNRPGTFRSTTGTTATGRAAFGSTLNSLALGSGEAFYETAVNVATLSNATERFSTIVGFYDSTTANQVDAVAFVYDEGGVSTGSTASANWQVVTSSNSTRTWTTTSNAVSAATWVKLGILVNAAGTSVGFYINGTLVATHTTNIPTGTTRAVGFGSQMLKSIGTTARTMDIDYIESQIQFTTAR